MDLRCVRVRLSGLVVFIIAATAAGCGVTSSQNGSGESSVAADRSREPKPEFVLPHPRFNRTGEVQLKDLTILLAENDHALAAAVGVEVEAIDKKLLETGDAEATIRAGFANDRILSSALGVVLVRDETGNDDLTTAVLALLENDQYLARSVKFHFALPYPRNPSGDGTIELPRGLHYLFANDRALANACGATLERDAVVGDTVDLVANLRLLIANDRALAFVLGTRVPTESVYGGDGVGIDVGGIIAKAFANDRFLANAVTVRAEQSLRSRR